MDIEEYIITIYCLLDDLYQKCIVPIKIRKGGFEPKMSDVEVLTMEVVGEYLGIDTDKGIYEYFLTHFKEWFPNLGDRTSFARQAANLWYVKWLLWQKIVQLSEEDKARYQIADTAPLPVAVITRANRTKRFRWDASVGYCAAKKLCYYGFKQGIRISESGMILHVPLLEARPHDVNHLGDLIEGIREHTTLLLDKGFIMPPEDQKFYEETYKIQMFVPKRKNMRSTGKEIRWLSKKFTQMRRMVETVIGQLTERYNLQKVWARDHWHLSSRLIRKVLSHTLGVFLNMRLGRFPTDLDGLVNFAT